MHFALLYFRHLEFMQVITLLIDWLRAGYFNHAHGKTEGIKSLLHGFGYKYIMDALQLFDRTIQP